MVSDKQIIRIYDGHTKGSQPSLQSYNGFLSEPSDSCRRVIKTGKRVCPRYKKVLVLFSYPETMNCNEILVVPFLSERVIELNAKHRQACWIGQASQIGQICEYFNRGLKEL